MAALSQQESRKRYSWWWDSHISPKNSKWLQENLTGMDSKVKQMIKLIEEDADSFARRAEMYYKRRPELMRLVEELYRAYRALAERYDHATGVIRHAHKTMVEAFPDQDLMSDDLGEFFDPEEMQKDALGLASPDIQVPKRRGLKQIDFFEKGTARKSLNFNEAREKERNLNYGGNHNAKNVEFSDSKLSMSKYDADISPLREALVKLEAEKEAGLLKYQTSLERLSNLQKEIRLAHQDSDKLTARAIKAEAEVELLNGALIELKAEKELVHLQYQKCLNKISILEEHIFCFEQGAKETSDRAKKAESEVQLLKQDLAMLQADKEAIAAQHKQCIETITDVETKLQQAEESVKRTNERANVAESKIETLNLDIIKLTEEKNAYSVQCQQYLERISTLEFQILFLQEDTQRLNEEISSGVLKLKDVEDKCLSIATSHQSLQSDVESLITKMESKNKELTEKQIELNRLWTCVQEERSRFVEAETAFQTLQNLHNESQEELITLASELQNKAQTVLDLEEHNHCLQEEVLKIKEENRTLNEINLSSAVSMESMQDEVSSLRATIIQLHEEIQIRVAERNTLQKEIYNLREEFNELKLKHAALLDQMESLELDPESFGSSVMELRDNSSKLNDAYEREKNEKVALLEKMKIMARLVERNALLEISIADLNSELQQVKEKMKTLEETCHLLVEERSAFVAEKNALRSQIHVLTKNSGALLVKNFSLENSLADANAELDALQEKSRRLEDSLLLIGIEKTGLLNESEILSSQLNVTKCRLQDIEIKYEKLEVKNLDLETEKQFLICSISEICDSLNSAKKENSDIVKFYQTQLASLGCQLHLLQEEALLSKNMYNEELDTTVRATIEISILQSFLQALHGNNTSLGRQCLELFEASQASEKNISDLEHKYADQQGESEALFEVLKKLEVKNFNLETEKQFLICRIGEMCDSLNSAKKETTDTVKFYQTQLASSECQLHLLQEEVQLLKNMCNEEQDTTVRATFEISILHSFLQEIHGNNTSLGRHCLELLEASHTLEKVTSDLKQKYDDQQVESKVLFEVLDQLEVKNLDLETLKQFLICSISEMCNSWNSAKKENSATVKFYQAQLASLEWQLHLSQEEAQLLKNMYNEEQDTTVRATFEISILHSFLQELHGNNTSLGRKCLELFESSQTSEKLISDLEQKYADQQAESKELFEALEKLRAGFYQISKTLNFDKGSTPRDLNEEIPLFNQLHSSHMLETAREFKKALTTTVNENHQLLLEKSVLITLLQQLRVEAVDIETEKCILSQNLEASTQRLLTEVHVLSETNEGLKKTLEEGDYREQLLRNDVEELSLNLLDMQGSYQTLQKANNLVLEEKKSLMKEVLDLKGAKCALEEDIHEVLGDTVSLSNIFLAFKDFYSDKSMEVKKLDGSMCELHHIKDTLEEVIKLLEEKLQIMLEDKSRLVESLDASDNELKTLRSINSQLNHEVFNGKELLSQKEMGLSEAKLQHVNLLNEQTVLQSLIKDLKGRYENEKASKEDQAEQIFKLIKENEMSTVEYDDLCCSKHSLETELLELIKKHENVIARELLYRKEYEELLNEQQVSCILEACYHEKFQELSKNFESTVITVSSLDAEARLLKERLTVLEVENAGLKAHFKECNSAVRSLSDSVACLEIQAISHEKLLKIDVTKDAGTKQVPVQVDPSNAIWATGCSELKHIQSRIQAVELAVKDARIASVGSLGSSVEAQRPVHKEDLVSGRSFCKERVESRRQRRHNSGDSSELSELPKDIMLDQVSDCSSYGQSRREFTATDNYMLESWGTTNKDSSLDFSDAKAQKPSYVKKTPASEITAEKEVTVVEKLEIPKSPKDPQQTGKKVKILERLHFDAQKLANLRKTVHDLKSKVGIALKSKRTKGVIEFDTVTEQLEEADEAIEKLYGINENLTQTVEDNFLSSKDENGLDESGTVRRRRVFEQVRRASENISRLHFEVQKLQFMLHKLEGEKDMEVKTGIIPRSPRVRLQDYLYGSSRQVFAHKQNRRQFCGCVKPSTKGD